MSEVLLCISDFCVWAEKRGMEASITPLTLWASRDPHVLQRDREVSSFLVSVEMKWERDVKRRFLLRVEMK